MYTGRLRSLAQPLLHTIFEGKYTPFVSWYPFHTPSLGLCFPFNCCKCSVFKIYETITKPERFLDFFHSHQKHFQPFRPFYRPCNYRFTQPFIYLKPEKTMPFDRGIPLQAIIGSTLPEPPISGHPRGTGSWPLNVDCSLNKGLS